MMRMFLFSQYQKWHEILAKKTRIYGIAMQRYAYLAFLCGSSVVDPRARLALRQPPHCDA